jgi:hypothetical protein
MAKEITRLFPNCPPARALDENAVTLAVVASVRHDDTPYDELLMAGAPRHYTGTRSATPSTRSWTAGGRKASFERLGAWCRCVVCIGG